MPPQNHFLLKGISMLIQVFYQIIQQPTKWTKYSEQKTEKNFYLGIQKTESLPMREAYVFWICVKPTIFLLLTGEKREIYLENRYRSNGTDLGQSVTLQLQLKTTTKYQTSKYYNISFKYNFDPKQKEPIDKLKYSPHRFIWNSISKTKFEGYMRSEFSKEVFDKIRANVKNKKTYQIRR